MVTAVLACCTAPAVSASRSPTELLASIFGAARAQQSVHYVTSASGGAVRVSLVGDAGLTRGIQRITYHKGARTGHVTVIVAADTAYVRGDTVALVQYMGFKAVPAAKYAGVWVLIPRTDKDYSTVALAVRFSSTLDELDLSGPLSRVPDTTIGGQRVLGVRGKSSSSGITAVATLYAQAAGPPLPVEEVLSNGSTRGTVILSKWNEPIGVTAPTAAVPISATGLE